MAVANRLDPSQVFAPDVWEKLTSRSSWRGLALVAHAWSVVALCLALAALWPWCIPVLMPFVAGRRLGLFILSHEAAHGHLHPNRKINDAVAIWLCQPDLHAYRKYHLQHHRFVQQAEDPDLVLSRPFPTTRHSFGRKVLRDLTGQTFFRQQFGPSLARLGVARNDGSLRQQLKTEWLSQRRYLLGNALAWAMLATFGWGWLWFVMWWIPSVTWFQLFYRIRNIAEHALLNVDELDPLRQARTTKANLLERALVAPYWVNYHCEHHLFTQLPCWHLPKAHARLLTQEITAEMEIQPSYFELMRRATSNLY
jgi:fatty acid desaturase